MAEPAPPAPAPEPAATADLRLGYLLGEWAWGRGFATELVGGLVKRCSDCTLGPQPPPATYLVNAPPAWLIEFGPSAA